MYYNESKITYDFLPLLPPMNTHNLGKISTPTAAGDISNIASQTMIVGSRTRAPDYVLLRADFIIEKMQIVSILGNTDRDIDQITIFLFFDGLGIIFWEKH